MPRRDPLTDSTRLAELNRLEILDTPPEPAYDDIARLAAACCGSEIAAVNFVDDRRHWTKAIVGVPDGQGVSVSAELSFCAATVATPGGRLTVPDTKASETWRGHPLVVGGPQVGFYAGATIVVSGEPVGVVCVFGDRPRKLGDKEEEALAALARQASAQLDLRRRNAELRDAAVRDPLTGVANRTLLLDRLELALAQREREGGHVGIFFCDVDEFKAINDRRGHDEGDRVLRRIAERLQAATRATDTVARIAGDEFVVLCPGLDSPQELDELAARIDELVHAPDLEGEPALRVRLSIGAALADEREPAASLLRRADQEMYRHKRRHRVAATA